MNGEIRNYFQLEARELIDRLTVGVAQLEGSRSKPETLAALARAAHTLKGAAHVVGEDGIASLAHQFEDALESYRKTSNAAGADRLLRLTDALAAALATVLADSHSDEEYPAAGVGAETPQDHPATSPGGSDSAEEAEETAPRLEPEATRSTIRVDRDQTARLLTQIHAGGALVAGLRASVEQLARLEAEAALHVASQHSQHREDYFHSASTQGLRALREQLAHDVERLDRQIIELQQSATRLNLVSTGNLLIEAGRIVRSTAATMRRDVVCVTEGGTDRVDLQIVEALQDALLHLLRNAVVHGIESSWERRRAGKPKTATITVTVRRSGSDVILTCADDGRGIALEPIRGSAVARGLMSAEEAAAASPEKLLALLLRHGFSTKAAADELAGRGVGLDAVHAAAERLHGTVRLTSEPGRGTVVTVTAPRTLFSLPVLVVTAGGGRYAVPVEAVEQTFRLERHHKVTGQGSRTVLLDREAMPYLVLEDVMPTLAEPSPGQQRAVQLTDRKGFRTCVVLRTDAGPLALAVDRVETMKDILVQPLPAVTCATAIVSGAALSSDGRPFLVLDPEALPGSVRHRGGETPPEGPDQSFRFGATNANQPILVIDDSLTTRMLEQSILEGEGYDVDVAVSAEQGLAMARNKRYSLFLVDVEMPGMNGFEFVRFAKADADLGKIPSILVTSLDTAADRERGRAAGAVSYVVKGEFNQHVYLNRIRAVMRGVN